MMLGALKVPDRRISTTEQLSDRKLTCLEARRGPQRQAAMRIGKSSLHLIDWETCVGSHAPNQEPQGI